MEIPRHAAEPSMVVIESHPPCGPSSPWHRCPGMLLPFLLLASMACWAARVNAIDTTPPTLNINATWIEKVGSVYHFKMMLDPFDDVGVDHIEFRDALNTTGAVPASVAWATYPWARGQPLDEGFICTALSLEVRAVDAAGNTSAVQKRTFKAPFPVSAPPNQDPVFSQPPYYLTFSGPTMDCKGLFSADFNGDGRDDTVQFDNATGFIKVRVQNANETFSSQVITLTAGTIQDGAIGDFDKDGHMDLIVVVNHDVVEYHNDGNNLSGLPTFSAITPPGRTGSGISSVEHIAVADLNGDGYPEAFIVGTGDNGSGGSVAKVEVLANDGAGSLYGFNTSLAPSTAGAGRIVVGDLNGDGRPDLAMVDTHGSVGNHHVIVFKCLPNLALGGEDDPTPANRPLKLSIVRDADAIAMGDVTGDGLPDLVVTIPYFGQLVNPPFNDGQNHNALLWQIIASDPVNGLTPLTQYDLLSAGPAAASASTFTSDVMIRNYTGTRLPQLLFTDEFNDSVKTVRLDVPLDSNNQINGIYTTSVKNFPAAAHPQRLTHARLGPHTRDDLVVASGHANQIAWLSNIFTTTSKTYDIIGGANTDSDPNGTPDTTGKLSYNVYPSGTINYSLTFVNNSATAITGGTVSITLPSVLTFLSGDAGNTVTTSGTSHIVSWTVDIPANSASVRNLSVQVGATTPLAYIAPAIALKKGTTTLASATMPKVNVREPLLFTLVTSSDSDASGLTVHTGEAIKYEFNVTNNSATTITNVKFGTAFPVGTKYLVESTPPAGTSFLKRGVSGKETGIDWTIASLPAHGFVSVFVLVDVTAAELATITESTATCTRGTFKIIAPTFKTTVSRSLEVILTKDVGIARPGDPVHYSFTVHNWSLIGLNNAKLVMLLPQGMSLTSVNSDDGTGNFVGAALNGDTLTGGTNPAIDLSGGPTLSTLKWSWTTFPSRTVRTVNFTCQAKWDDPLEYLINGAHITNAVSIFEYNFLGSLNTTSARIFAAAPVSTSASATTLQLLSTKVPTLSTPLSGGDPVAPPKLSLQKEAVADGRELVAGQMVATVVNDTSLTTDGSFTYALTVANATGAGTATNVQLRDFVPTGTTFLGFIARDGVNVPSYFGFHFFNAANKEIDATIPANIPLVRSFSFPVGNLAGGQSTIYTYKVQTTLAPGGSILSNSGGYSGKVGLYTFDPVTGYHLTASNLNFPINGGPKQLKVLVTAPAVFHLPGGIIKSRGEVVGTDIAAIGIPFEVLGGTGLNFNNIKMDVPLPKGFLGVVAQLFDELGVEVPGAATMTKNSAGVTTVSFGINALRHATALFQVQLDPATQSVLKNAAGQIIAPLSIKPTVTGSYTKAPVPPPLAKMLAASSPPPTPVIIPSLVSLAGALPIRATPVTKDSKIFIGRCAPAMVRRGENITYTIVVGNLTDGLLFGGVISMNVPTGTTYVSATHYIYNFNLGSGLDSGPIIGANLPAPVHSGSRVSWNIGGLANSEAGVVSLTVKVPDTFSGSRIDDNSCNFDSTNACGKSPGPTSVVVLSGNSSAQGITATQAVVEGAGVEFNSDVRTGLDARGFHVGTGSCTIGTGGCDLIHLTNDVVLIPMSSDRMMMLGPPALISASGARLVYDSPMMRVAVGPGTLAGGMGVNVSALPGLAGTPLVTPNSILLGLSTNSLVSTNGGNVVAAGAGNIVSHDGGTIIASGGGNVVAAGAGNLIGSDGAGLTGPNASKIVMPEGSASLLANSIGGKLVGSGGSSVVAAGAGNVVAAGAGNVVAAGAGNLIGHDGASLIGHDGASVVAAGAGNLLGQDGANVVSAGAGNVVAAGAGNLVNLNGVSSLANVK